MPSKNETIFIYFFIFCGALGFSGGSWVNKVQYGIAAVVSFKLLNKLLMWMDEWYLFLGSVAASLVAVYFIAHKFFTFYFILAAIYTAFIFYQVYAYNRDYDKEYSLRRPRPGFSKSFKNLSNELEEHYK